MPAGSDSLDTILKATPPGTRREDFLSGNGVMAEGAMAAWKRAVEDVFGAADLTGGRTTTAVLAPTVVDDGDACLLNVLGYRST